MFFSFYCTPKRNNCLLAESTTFSKFSKSVLRQPSPSCPYRSPPILPPLSFPCGCRSCPQVIETFCSVHGGSFGSLYTESIAQQWWWNRIERSLPLFIRRRENWKNGEISSCFPTPWLGYSRLVKLTIFLLTLQNQISFLISRLTFWRKWKRIHCIIYQ